MNHRLSIVLAAALAACAFASQAADKVWTARGTTTNWSEGANWLGGAAPSNGDRLIFTTGSHSTNDLGGASFDSIVVGGGISHTFDGARIDLVNADAVSIQDARATTFAGGIGLPGGRVTVAGANSTTNFTGGIFARGDCTLALGVKEAVIAGSNECRVESTTTSLVIRSGASLGAPRATITRGTLVVGDPALPALRVDVPISMRGLDGIPATIQTFARFGSVDFGGPIDMDGDIRFSSGADSNIRSSVGGLGKLTITVADNAAVTLSGDVSPHGGLEIAHGLVKIAASDAFRADDLTIDAGATLGLGGFIKSVAALRCSGNLELSAGAGMLIVNRPSSIDGCLLDLATPSHFPVSAGEVTLVKNNSGAALGHFVGLPEGAVLTDSDGVRAMITYRGGAGSDVTLVVAGPATTPSVQDLWWSGPAENGWGMSLVQHGDALFAALFIYDASGAPTWLVMPGGSWNATYTAYTGSIFAPHGTPYFAYDARQLAVGNAVGSMTLTFQDPAHAVLEYTVNGASGRKVLSREVFANGARTRPDRSDLWWGGAAQNGWGLTLLQQADALFGVWYTYDTSGAPLWFVMPTGTWTSANVYEGRIYRTTSMPWLGRNYDGSQFHANDVGSFAIRFDGDSARFDYSINGASGSIPITRQPF